MKHKPFKKQFKNLATPLIGVLADPLMKTKLTVLAHIMDMRRIDLIKQILQEYADRYDYNDVLQEYATRLYMEGYHDPSIVYNSERRYAYLVFQKKTKSDLQKMDFSSTDAQKVIRAIHEVHRNTVVRGGGK